MILDYVRNLGRYKGITPNLDIAIDYLLVHTADDINGRIEISGDEVYVSKQNPVLAPMNERRWENHFAYMDIHIAVEGSETLGFLNNADNITWNDINVGNDCELSNDDTLPHSVYLQPGMCMLLWPGEPHKPNIGDGLYTKLVVKVKVN